MLYFTKFQGAGNDFILIDDRASHFNSNLVHHICHRKFGIGADGVILLQTDAAADFRMRIFNNDGSEAGSCGNGLRCLMKFIADLGMPKRNYRIATGDRVVEAGFQGNKVRVHMGLAQNLKQLHIGGHEVYSLDTGVPHAVVFSPDADLKILGPLLRHHAAFQPAGTNVNIADLQHDGSVRVRTFERGVEGETLACGTGAAAVGVIASKKYQLPNPIQICSAGGEIDIYVDGLNVTQVGDAIKVFEGSFQFPFSSAPHKNG
jgi:diaminopimelate epimerase